MSTTKQTTAAKRHLQDGWDTYSFLVDGKIEYVYFHEKTGIAQLEFPTPDDVRNAKKEELIMKKPVPPGWVALFSKTHQQTYFVHIKTGVLTYNYPGTEHEHEHFSKYPVVFNEDTKANSYYYTLAAAVLAEKTNAQLGGMDEKIQKIEEQCKIGTDKMEKMEETIKDQSIEITNLKATIEEQGNKISSLETKIDTLLAHIEGESKKSDDSPAVASRTCSKNG